MTNTTDTYWSVDGVSLQTYAQNISTIGGLDKPPESRGQDIVIPYRVGEEPVDRVVGPRTLDFEMWVRGVNNDESTPADRARKFDDNWRALRNLLWREGEVFDLKKQFYYDGDLRSATAKARFVGGLEPKMYGRHLGRFFVQLKLHEAYFFDDTLVNYALVNGDQTINVLGDAATTNIIVTINGARNTPRIRTKSPKDITFEYADTLGAGDTFVADIKAGTAVTDPAATPAYDSHADVNVTGAPMFKLSAGDNVVNLSSVSGAGTAQLQARAAWL